MKRIMLASFFGAIVLVFALDAAATLSDSAAFGKMPAIGRVIPTLGSTYVNVNVPSDGSGIGINYSSCGSNGDQSQNITPTAGSPYSMTGINSSTYSLPALKFSGNYMITYQADIQAVGASTLPAYFWIDDWAVTGAASGTTPAGTNIRLLFTGDAPEQISQLSTVYPIYLYTIVYLPAGTTIYFPRIWTVANPSAVYPQLCVFGSNGTPPSYFSVYLLNSP